jgi:hypothetical protein
MVISHLVAFMLCLHPQAHNLPHYNIATVVQLALFTGCTPLFADLQGSGALCYENLPTGNKHPKLDRVRLRLRVKATQESTIELLNPDLN